MPVSGFDQRGLPVVTVSGEADDDGFHLFLSLRSKPLMRFPFSYACSAPDTVRLGTCSPSPLYLHPAFC